MDGWDVWMGWDDIAPALISCFARILVRSHFKRMRKRFSSLWTSIFVTGQEKMWFS